MVKTIDTKPISINMQTRKENELLKIVKNNYEEIASDFDKSRKNLFWPELSKLSANVLSGEKILDAGCGNGRLLELFKDKKISYLGFDNSHELIELAKKNYPQEKFVKADILDLSFLDNNLYDRIFCIAVIPHIPGLELRKKVLSSLYEKLAPGGQMILSFWDLRSQKKYKKQILIADLKAFFNIGGLDFGDLIFSWKGKEKSLRYYHAFKERELKKLAVDLNLNLKNLYRADNNFWMIVEK